MPPELSPVGLVWPHVYVHVPFCGRRCSYCDFSIAVRKDTPVAQFNDAILAELVTRKVAPSGSALRSLYFGGGTPSKLGGPGLASLLGIFQHRLGVEKFSTSPDVCEVTIEVNPEDITPEAAQAWAAAGVNRASIGVQSFDANVLHWMHREHSPEQVRAGVEILRGAGILELSLDLIFAVPDQLNRSWTRDLEMVLELGPDHLSFYGLTVEPHTPLGRWAARGEVAEAGEDRYEREFLEAHHLLASAGFEHYEVSNYARPGRRARHNSAYWSGAPYLGVGPSAHGFDGATRRWNVAAYADWLRVIGEGRDPLGGSEILTADQRLAEQVYLGLRTIDGLDIYENEVMTVSAWVDEGWAVLREASSPTAAARLVLTPQGWLRLDALAAALTSLRSAS